MLNDPDATDDGATGKTKMDSVGENKYGSCGAQNGLRGNPTPPFIG
jgi:hypothetical protein